MTIMDNIKGEFKTKNFSIYGQWTGILAIILCIALGIANIFGKMIIFSIICLVCGVLLIFVEIPILLRICPTSKAFDDFIKKFHTNWGRALAYLGMSAIQLGGCAIDVTSLLAAGIILFFAGSFYLVSALMGQEFKGSATLGGRGVASMIV
ncbi:hypothetical protein DFH27DRAFT_34865 [Peziza echinospora]|nr:hypothetical protein DFH27DRAFT_34865 [Peziza echinospora]